MMRHFDELDDSLLRLLSSALRDAQSTYALFSCNKGLYKVDQVPLDLSCQTDGVYKEDERRTYVVQW